jgi:Putative Flp pilus-assembly TadE/G-like
MRLGARDSGQATVLTILFVTVLLAMAAAVLDVGAWFHEKRKLQATVDAAALAGAQALPDDPGSASALALQYAGKNGGGIGAANISFSTTYSANDTIKVVGTRPAPGFFSGILGVGTVEVHATARARTAGMSQARYVAPITVNYKHPMLQCAPPPCAGATHIDLLNLGPSGGGSAPGSFGLINLDRNSGNGNAGAPVVASWMSQGFQDYMPLGKYYAVPSANFNNSQFKSALNLRLNTEVLFPIYKTITGPGSNAQYDIIGWVGFVPTSFDAHGSNGTVYGSFKRVIWAGIQGTGGNQQNFGAYSVQLVE